MKTLLVYFQNAGTNSIFSSETIKVKNLIVGDKKPALSYGCQKASLITTTEGSEPSKFQKKKTV